MLEEKKKTKKIEKPKTDIEAMPSEIMGDPAAGEDLADPIKKEEWELPAPMAIPFQADRMPFGTIVDPLPDATPTYTPSGDMPPMM